MKIRPDKIFEIECERLYRHSSLSVSIIWLFVLEQYLLGGHVDT